MSVVDVREAGILCALKNIGVYPVAKGYNNLNVIILALVSPSRKSLSSLLHWYEGYRIASQVLINPWSLNPWSMPIVKAICGSRTFGEYVSTIVVPHPGDHFTEF